MASGRRRNLAWSCGTIVACVLGVSSSAPAAPTTRPAAEPAAPPSEEPVKPPRVGKSNMGRGLWRGLIMYLAFDGEGVNVRDHSGQSNTGRLVGGRRVKDGKRDKGCYLDADGDHVYVSSTIARRLQTQLTLAAWVKLASFNTRGYANEHGYIINKGKDLWWNPTFFVGYSKSKTGKNPAMFHVCRHGAPQNGGGKTVLSTTSVVVGKWIHLVGTYDGKQLKIYVNGRFEAAAAYAGPLREDNAPLLVGGGNLSGTGWGNQFTVDGTVDDVMVWNRALDGEEVRSLYYGGIDGRVTVERSKETDCITLVDGMVLTGEILGDSYQAKGAFGTVTVPAARLASIVRASRGMEFALTDGQILSAAMPTGSIRLKRGDGTTQAVRWDSVRWCAYRITPARPVVTVVQEGRVLLKDGSRLLLKTPAPAKVHLATPYGTQALPGANVYQIQDFNDGKHRVWTTDGSSLTGTLVGSVFKLPLALGPTVTIRQQDVFRLLPGNVMLEIPTTVLASMKNGDLLGGTLAGKRLAFKTEFGQISPPMSAVRSIGPGKTKGTATLKMNDGSVHRGRFTSQLVMVLAPGLSVPIPIDQLETIKPFPYPTSNSDDTAKPDNPDKPKPPPPQPPPPPPDGPVIRF